MSLAAMPPPRVEHEVLLTVRVLIPTRLENDSGRPLKRKFDDANDVQYALFCKLDDNLGTVWNRAYEVFKTAYSDNITTTGYFSKMTVRGSDVFPYYKVSQFFKVGADDNVLVVVQDPMSRNDSLPPNSILRPKGFHLPTPGRGLVTPESHALKRRKVHGGEVAMTINEISPEMPIESNEETTELAQRHHEHQALEPRRDAEGYKIPTRPILLAKSRRSAQTAAPKTTSSIVQVQDSQPNTAAPKPQSASEALQLRKQATAGHQQSMLVDHSSPAEAAATRAKPAAAAYLRSNQAANSSSTLAEGTGVETNSGDTRSTLPTPPSPVQVSADLQTPTSAQPPPSSHPPFTNLAHRRFQRTSASNELEDDEIVDDLYTNDIDDQILGEVDDDYIPDKLVVSRGRTRSRSLETIPPPRNASDGLEHPSSQLPEGTSTTVTAARTAEDPPTSTNAFDDMRSSQAARRSSSSRNGSLNGKWSKEEDIALLKGMKANMMIPIIKRTFKIDRSESAIRNRRIMLLKLFPGGNVPSDHEFYAEFETYASSLPAVPAAARWTVARRTAAPRTAAPRIAAPSTAGPSAATLPLTSPTTATKRQAWTPDQVQTLCNAVAQGFTMEEIRPKHFPNRSEKSVMKKTLGVFVGVVAREKKAGTIPDDSVYIHGWDNKNSLAMRRAADEGLTAYEAGHKYFPEFPIDSVATKYHKYQAQRRKLNMPSTSESDGELPAAEDEEEIGRRNEEAQRQSESTQHKEATERVEQSSQLPTSTVVPDSLQPREFGAPTQLKKTQGNGGQARLNFKLDKKKGVDGPSGAALRDQLNREYGQPSARAPVQPVANAQPASEPAEGGGVEREPAPPGLDGTNEIEELNLCHDESDDDYLDIDRLDLVDLDNDKPATFPIVAGENTPVQAVTEENNNSAPLVADLENIQVPATAEESNTTKPVVTAPYDLRTRLSHQLDSRGRHNYGRPGFPAPFDPELIKTDREMWDLATKLHKNRKGLVRTQYDFDWLAFQSYIAMCGGDFEEMNRLDKKLKQVQTFLKLKLSGEVAEDMKFADWVPVPSATNGSVDEEFDRDDEDDEDIESDGGDGDFEGGNGAQLPDEFDYPHGVDRSREVVEVEDDQEEEVAPANPRPTSRSSLTVYHSAEEGSMVVPPEQSNDQQKPAKKQRKRKRGGPVEKKPKKKRKRSKPDADPAALPPLAQITPEESAQTGIIEQSSHTGSNEQSARSATTEQSARSGTTEQSSRTGTNQQSARIGANQQTAHSGANQQSAHNGTIQQSAQNGTIQQSVHNGTTQQSTRSGANQLPENAQGWIPVNPRRDPAGEWTTVIGRPFHIPHVPIRRTPPPYTRPRMPYPDSEEDSSSSDSDSSDGGN